MGRADAGGTIIDTTEFSETPEREEADSSRERIEALADIICSGGQQSAAALLVLMGRLQNSTEPAAIANTAKHLAFTRCGELNAYGIVETQIEILETKFFAGDSAQG